MSKQLVVPSHSDLRRGLSRLMQWRWILVIALVAGISVADSLFPGSLPMPIPVLIAASMAAYNGLFYWYTGFLETRGAGDLKRRWQVLANVQILMDLVALTLLLHYTGGIETPLFLFYIFYVTAASILLPRLSSFGCAALASTLFIALVSAEYWEVIPHIHLEGFVSPQRYQRGVYVAAVFGVLTATLFLCAYLISAIADELRGREEELLASKQSCELRARDLTRLNARLEELDKARSQFIRLVTHELRAPVAAIQSYLKLILEGYVPPEKQLEIIAKSERRALEQLALISDLLDLAHLQAGKAKEALQLVDVADVLGGVAELMQAHAEDKDLLFSVQVEDSVPPVQANPEHIKQLWTNLISNAIKYTEPGGIVVVSLSQNPKYVLGTVRDTGIGMAPEQTAHVFEEFYRTEEAKAMERQGTGLGLAIVKRTVESYGGRIWLESEKGKGSKFNFALPKTT